VAKLNDIVLLREKLLDFVADPDPLLSMLEWLTSRLMQIEAEAKVGVEKGKHDESRTTHFSGVRVRRFDTRLGTMYLLVPKLRRGGYVPFSVTERKRSEHALIEMVLEAYANGVSTRKVDHPALTLGIEDISASQVSDITKELDAQVEAFRSRPLDATYPVIWVDAVYEKIRRDGRVVSMAVMVVTGVNPAGIREILAVQPLWNESEESYTELFEGLKARGLESVHLVVSDAHQGLQAAIRKEFLGSSWQRCKVHFRRNVLARVGHRDKEVFAAKLKQIWLQNGKEGARRAARELADEYAQRFPEAIAVLEDGLEDSLSFYDFPMLDTRKISSTKGLEGLNREIRRRSAVVGAFPSEESYIRLVMTYLMEYSEDWSTSRCYLSPINLEDFMASIRPAACWAVPDGLAFQIANKSGHYQVIIKRYHKLSFGNDLLPLVMRSYRVRLPVSALQDKESRLPKNRR
jgi:transposase-like protein